MLRGALSEGGANRIFIAVASVSPIPYDEEIGDTLADIKNVVKDFSGNSSYSVSRRISSRLTNLTMRIQRLETQGDQQ